MSEFLREARHTVDIIARMEVSGGEEASLGSDPEVAPGSDPTLRELRWVGVEELEQIELLPRPLKARLLEDAGDGWAAGEVYLGDQRG